MHIYTGQHPWLAPGNPMERLVLGNVYGPELELAVELLARGGFPAEELVTHRYSLDEINEAFQVKLDRPAEAAKVQIIF